MLRILGIDPGSRITGYGLVESDGMRSVHIAHGALRLEGEALPPRLGEIYARVSALIEEHGPAVMAIEQVFVAKNAASALKLGQGREIDETETPPFAPPCSTDWRWRSTPRLASNRR